MTINQLQSILPRSGIPYSRMTPDSKKIDAEGSARKLYDKKPTTKEVASLRIWLGKRADRRFVCWDSEEQKIYLIAEYLMPRLKNTSLLTEGSVDVTEIAGIEYILDVDLRKTVTFPPPLRP